METKKILLLALGLVVLLAVVLLGIGLFTLSLAKNSTSFSTNFSFDLNSCKPGEWESINVFGRVTNYSVVGLSNYRNKTVCHSVAHVFGSQSNETDDQYWTDENNSCIVAAFQASYGNDSHEVCHGNWPGYNGVG